MSTLKQQISSFLYLRASILRAIAYGDLSGAEIMAIAQINPGSLTLRRQNPDLWTIDELGRLSVALGHEATTLKAIRQLASLLMLLPDSKQRQVLQRAQLTRRKLLVRQTNYNYWKVWELQRIAEAL
ncbi:hypothetical protein [Rudanella lutea]|uniref:hypothetical protein n=1 Tax=Rudanella lutea TaxID=451374 RepID=UPI0003767C15|nr:hypothetical protein [Rudanella lutea]